MECPACGRALANDGFPGALVRCLCGHETATAAPGSPTRPPALGAYREPGERASPEAFITCPCCGAPCASGVRACPHCDVELASVRCTHCFALHFPGARFCARCGKELEPEPLLDATDAPCPRCGKPLRVARSGGAELAEGVENLASFHECVACGGLFLDNAALERVFAREPEAARRRPPGVHAPAPPSRAPRSSADVVRYLKCPVCNQLMNRVNFARRSGIIVDVCSEHGTWFDAGELTRAVEFAADDLLGELLR